MSEDWDHLQIRPHTKQQMVKVRRQAEVVEFDQQIPGPLDQEIARIGE